MKKILNDHSNSFFRILKRCEISSKLNLKEYEESLKNLSNHKKLIKIDLNGKEKKISKYFFDKNKYIYIKNKDDVKAFDNKENKESKDIFVIKKSLKKRTKLQKSLKDFKSIYDLSEEEFIYMKFIYKIKIKNIFSLINNLRKNIYVDKQKKEILLNCIYKYLSYNCYVLSKNEFFFFVYIFPQYLKYSDKVIYYVTSLLDNNNIDIDEIITLTSEINLIHINYHIREKYIDYLNRNIHKINLFQIFNILTKSSYMFSILLNYSKQKKDFTFIEKLLNIIKEKKINFNEEIKSKYLKFLSDYVNNNNNIYLNTFFSDVYILLYKKIFLANYERIYDLEYIKKVIKFTSHDFVLRHINNIILQKNEKDNLSDKTNVKIKIFPSFLEEKKTITEKSDINLNNHENYNSMNDETIKDNISTDKLRVNRNEKEKNNRNYLNKFSFENKNKNIICDENEMYTKEDYAIITNKNPSFQKLAYLNNNENIHEYNSENVRYYKNNNNNENNNENQNLINNKKLVQQKESINIFQVKKKIFCFTYPSDKIKDIKYEELRERYKIPTKITDKNVKMLLKFLKISYNSRNSYLDEIFDKKNIFQIISNIKNKKMKYDKNNQNHVKLLYQFVDKWNDVIEKKGVNENPFNLLVDEEKKIKKKYEKDFSLITTTNINIDKKKENSTINIDHSLLIPETRKKGNSFETYISLYEKFNLLEFHNKNNFFKFNLEKKENNYILNIVNNIYFNSNFHSKIYHKSQINSISKFLFFYCNSFESCIEDIKRYNTKCKIANNLDCFTKTFYEIFTYVLKNIYLINISNYFYIFVAIFKFINASPFSMNEEENQNKNKNTFYNNAKLTNLLYIIHLIKEYEYNNITDILNDKNNHNYFLYNEFYINNINDCKKMNYDNIHEQILNNFRLDDIYNSDKRKNELTLKNNALGDFKNDIYEENINNVNIMNNEHNSGIINRSIINNSNIKFCNNIFINSYNFIMIFLNNYLDFSNFKMNKFLIIIFYLYKITPSNIRFMYHLESKLHKNHINFMNKYFYIYNGLNKNKMLLNKDYITLIKKYDINECDSYPIYISSKSLINNCKYNIYDNIENVFKKKKNVFLLKDILNFTFIYSLNKFYYSTIYYEISKCLYKISISVLNEKIKILLFFLFFQCKHVYKPFSFLLLSEVMKSYKSLGRINLYILCNFILILIKDSNIKIKNDSYLKRKFSEFHWNYFFPLELFISENLLIFTEEKKKNLEKNIESKEANITCIKEKMNVDNPFIFNLKHFKEDFKVNIPLVIDQYKQYNQIKNIEEIKNINNKNLSSFFYFDDVIESEIFKNALNFLSYDYVTNNFQISKKSLYHDILLHLKEN